MSPSFPRVALPVTPFALMVLVFCLSVLNPSVSAKTTIAVTTSYILTGQTIDGTVYNVGAMTTSSKRSLNYFTDCTIKGEGLGFTGFTSSVSSSTIPVFNLTMVQTKVTSATIVVTGFYPPYSTLMISGTTATMSSTTTLYDFRALVVENHVVLYMLDTTATWNVDSAGGVVILVGGTTRQLFQTSSGFYMYNTHATNAVHILHQVQPNCAGSLKNCLDIYGGLIAIDNVTCVSCKGPFLQGDQPLFFSNAYGGVVRISNCTSTGGQPFIHAPGQFTFDLSKTGNLVIYGITADGDFFSSTSGSVYLDSATYMSFMHIDVPSLGVQTSIPVQGAASCTVWAGNVTINNVLMTSLATLSTNGFLAHYFLDPYSKVTAKTGVPSVTESVGDPASVFCARPSFTTVSWEDMGTWKRAHCNCASGSYGPYCMPVVDPVLYYANYKPPTSSTTAEKSKMSTSTLIAVIVGPICGGVVLLIVVLVVVCCCCRKKTKENSDSDANSAVNAAFQLGCQYGSMYSGKNSQAAMSFHSNNPLDVLSRNNSQRSMSFCNEDPLAMLSRNNSQMPMMMYDEAAAPVSVWSNAQGPMQSGDIQMQQMEPRVSFMRQASSGGLNGVYSSSNQMQYF